MTGPEDAEKQSTKRASGPSIGDLLAMLVRSLTGLVRGEISLMRAELAEAGRQIASGLEMMAAGAILLIVAVFVLVQAGIIALAQYVGPLWASVLIGAGLALVGLILVLVGRNKARAARLVPRRTLDQTSRDVRLPKERM